MATFRLLDDAVEIDLSLADEILSLHGRLRIPYGHIEAVAADPVPQEWFRGVRMGTNLPGLKVAGSFLTPDGVRFFDFHDPNRCVTLSLRHDRYVQVTVEVDAGQDATAVARSIQDRLA